MDNKMDEFKNGAYGYIKSRLYGKLIIPFTMIIMLGIQSAFKIDLERFFSEIPDWGCWGIFSIVVFAIVFIIASVCNFIYSIFIPSNEEPNINQNK